MTFFSDIMKGFELAAVEKYSALGELIIYRKAGWPMGGSHFEPGTMVDVGHFGHNLHINIDEQKRVGLHIEGCELVEVLMGVQHVDDIFLGSQIFGADCTINSIGMTFPNDMGFECEERGKRIRFLTTFLKTEGSNYECRPYNPNIDFVLERCCKTKSQ